MFLTSILYLFFSVVYSSATFLFHKEKGPGADLEFPKGGMISNVRIKQYFFYTAENQRYCEFYEIKYSSFTDHIQCSEIKKLSYSKRWSDE